MRTPAACLLACVLASSAIEAQRGAANAPVAPATARASAPIDLTGYWVSIVNEDWRWRMVTPPKGDFPGLPLNAEGQRVANAWDPATDGSCLAYGAGGLMRMPGRLHITWANDDTMQIDTDAGVQTRRLAFGPSPATGGERSLQGYSRAAWERAGRGTAGRGGRGAPGGGVVGPGAGSSGGALKVVTTNLSGGWVRKNGVPYSDQTTVTEYFDRFAAPNGDEWLVVTTILSDPRYWNADFITSSHFRKERDGSKWDPTPCRS
jgi:hypothetical protein